MKTRSIRFKKIKAIFTTLTVKEDPACYISPADSFTSAEQVYNIFKFMQVEAKEYFYSLHLDGKNKILCVDEISVGSLNQSIVHPREVFKTALLSSAAAIILVHNHPSGGTEPSQEDKEITRRLKEAGELLGIRVLDHIIIGDRFFSFASCGML